MTTAPDGGGLTEAEAPTGHRYHVVDGLGGQWLCETSAQYPEPTPVGRVDDILAAPTAPDTEAIAAALEAAADAYVVEYRYPNWRERKPVSHWLRDRAAAIREGSDT